MTYYLGYKLGWFPNGGYEEIAASGLWQWFYHLILPWTALAILFIGVYSRIVRSNVLDTINDDYVRTRGPRASPSGACSRATCCATR